MKKIKLLLFLGAFLGVVIFAALLGPYLFYTKILYRGASGSYLRLEKLPKQSHVGSLLNLSSVQLENQDLWNNFHFGNFILPLPLHHPQILVLPQIMEYFENQFLSFGAILANTDLEEFASFLIVKPEQLDWNDFEGKLFELPVTKKLINEKSVTQIWKDLFTKDLNILLNSGIMSVPYRELIYNLFIQALRIKYFPDKVLKISFLEDKDLGVVEVESQDERYSREILYTLHNGVIYKIRLRFRKWTVFAESIRNRFLINFDFKTDVESAAAPIYAEYKALSFKEKIDQEGMTYLYAAWSHVPNNKEFLREMIQFLERGKNNIHHLNSLYQYGYKRFGSSFSLRDEKRKEKADEKLERKIKEELEAEIRQEEKKQDQTSEGRFENENDRVRFLLRKAKDSGTNSDQNDEVLSD